MCVGNIQEISQKFKSLLTLPDMAIGILIFVVGLGSFALGRISADDSPSERIPVHEESLVIGAGDTQGPQVGSPSTVATPEVATTTKGPEKEGGYVASKNGTKYHLPWCSGALRIKEENKVWFQTKEEAQAQGYAPAANCKGI